MLSNLVDRLFPTVRAGLRPPEIDVAWSEELAVTVDEVIRAVRDKGKPNSAPGPDGVKGLEEDT